jgi:uncharacterized protein
MSKAWCTDLPDGIRLTVNITPNAKRTEVIGVLDDALKIKLQAQPIEGKANEALVRYLSDVLNVARRDIQITHGLTSKRKTIEVLAVGLTVQQVHHTLLGTI